MTGLGTFMWGVIFGALIAVFAIALLSMAHEEDD